ncbi:CheC, inhibitor of MCP methylation [Arcobacter nitrofigilis DSM 7299]|uniref:CheC, inhibitor of MCP methylation n=1 Tax=Arcobacter nitrofigilis (strain ATCC 33309 / DSM 7299 / CCUG 15893 / LMG 7604 / NCTC 12251 / CI) TaxID=572480 RepID=D5V821_ARCNC|nr:chemotaxis protein CheX [Arcobacter nitrofigilis]ADG94791.1 CheC, inhibitor of MCP methylation [Arcobacter nitrofigilis DSM 7299]
MNDSNCFNDDQKDCLQELMNISYGSATAAIADIIGKFAKLSIPKIVTLSSSDFKDYIQEKVEHYPACYLVSQLIDGKLSGENLFLIDENSLKNLALQFDLNESDINEDELKDVVLEITNIISSTTSSKLAELIETDILFSPPDVRIVESAQNLEEHYHVEYNHIIIISTLIEFEVQNIHSELVMMLKDDSIGFMKSALDKIMDEI